MRIEYPDYFVGEGTLIMHDWDEAAICIAVACGLRRETFRIGDLYE